MAFNPNAPAPQLNNDTNYGVQPTIPNQQMDQWKVAAGLAAMPNSDLTEGLFNTRQPTGDMVGRVYVGQSPLQNLNASLRQGMGGMMVKQRADQAKNLIEGLRQNSESKLYGGGMQGYGTNTAPAKTSDNAYADLDRLAKGYVGPNGESIG